MEWLETLPAWVQTLFFWLTGGTGVGLTTLLISQLKIKNIKKQAALDAKDEQIEALIQTILDLKGIVFTLVEMISMLIQTSKSIPTEIKEKSGAMVDVMRRDFGLKVKESVAQAIALAKEKSLASKQQALAELEAVKTTATSNIEGLKAIANEILSKEINQN